MRGERRVGRATRIEVVTEGVLTRRLQRDPTLDGVGILIFDEFHERSLDADLGLALALRTKALLRDDLRIVVMSATLDGESVARLLGDAPIVTSDGRSFPVETRYVEPRRELRIEGAVANAIVEALRGDEGDVLVFLPGAGEIRRVEALLAERLDRGVVVTPLYGLLERDAQDRALLPDRDGRRKIVLSTSIAETSLTIEGIRVVVDSGLSRAPRFSPRTGMTRLETVRVSRSSADQRRGRAGRLGAGRLLSSLGGARDHSSARAVSARDAPRRPRAARARPRGGRCERTLELAWLDPPPAAAFAQARELLRRAGRRRRLRHGDGARAGDGASSAVHPRLAHMLVRAKRNRRRANGVRPRRAALGARRAPIATGRHRCGHLAQARPDARIAATARADVDREALRRARLESDRLAARLASLAVKPGPPVKRSTGLPTLVALAYPDRVAQRRPGGTASALRVAQRPRRGAARRRSARGSRRSSSPPNWTIASRRAQVFLAAAIDEDDVRRLFADQIASEESVEFDDATGTVLARRVERLGAILLRESSIAAPSEESLRAALLHAIRRRGVATLPWSDGAMRIRERMAFVAANDREWPDVSDDALAARLDEWLAAVARRRSAPLGASARRSRRRARLAARLAAASRARCARAVARRRADRVAYSDRLLGSARAGSRGAVTGSVRADRVAARSRRPRSGDDAAPLAGAPARAGDARPRGILAHELLRRAKGSARPLPEARVAGRSAHRRADETRQAAPLSATAAGAAIVRTARRECYGPPAASRTPGRGRD